MEHAKERKGRRRRKERKRERGEKGEKRRGGGRKEKRGSVKGKSGEFLDLTLAVDGGPLLSDKEGFFEAERCVVCSPGDDCCPEVALAGLLVLEDAGSFSLEVFSDTDVKFPEGAADINFFAFHALHIVDTFLVVAKAAALQAAIFEIAFLGVASRL